MRVPIAALLVFLAGCGGGAVRERPAAPAAGVTTYTDDRYGFSVAFPSDWHRSEALLTPDLLDPREILAVGTAEVPEPVGETPCAQHALAAFERLGPADVYLTVQEARSPSAEMVEGSPRIAEAPADDTEMPACLRREVPFRTHWMPFRSGDRGFYALAAVGDDAPPERRRQLQAVVDSLTFERRHREEDLQRGVIFRYPPEWRIYPFELTGTVGLPHQIALGTFDVEQEAPANDCRPAPLIEQRPPDGGALFVFEYADLAGEHVGRVPRRPRRFAVAEPEPQPYECFDVSHLIRWREQGRVFQAHLFGPPRRVRQALGVLDSFTVLPQPG